MLGLVLLCLASSVLAEDPPEKSVPHLTEFVSAGNYLKTVDLDWVLRMYGKVKDEMVQLNNMLQQDARTASTKCEVCEEVVNLGAAVDFTNVDEFEDDELLHLTKVIRDADQESGVTTSYDVLGRKKQTKSSSPLIPLGERKYRPKHTRKVVWHLVAALRALDDLAKSMQIDDSEAQQIYSRQRTELSRTFQTCMGTKCGGKCPGRQCAECVGRSCAAEQTLFKGAEFLKDQELKIRVYKQETSEVQKQVQIAEEFAERNGCEF